MVAVDGWTLDSDDHFTKDRWRTRVFAVHVLEYSLKSVGKRCKNLSGYLLPAGGFKYYLGHLYIRIYRHLRFQNYLHRIF